MARSGTPTILSVAKLPRVPVVYAMYGGPEVVYVGIAEALRNRIKQHLVARSSSVTRGTSAAHLNPDYITEVRWWTHPDFARESVREAAEVIAFEVLTPILRSRGTTTERAKQLCADEEFSTQMRALFNSQASGKLIIPSLQDALERIELLEKRVSELEKKLYEVACAGSV